MNTIVIIWNFIKKYYPLIFFVIMIVLSVLLFQTCSTLRTEREQREFIERQNAQNMNALKDSLTVVFDKKLKAYVWEKQNYLVNKLEDLEKYNKDLYNELKKVKGDVIAAIDSKVKIEVPDVAAGNELVTVSANDNLYGLNFKKPYKDAGFEQIIEGQSRFKARFSDNKWLLEPDSTCFFINKSTLDIKYGFRDLKDKYEVFAISQSPIVKFNELDGVLILDKLPPKPPEKPKKFGFGPYIGFGLNTDPNLSNPRFGWSMGVSVHYDIWQWRFGKK